MNINFSSSGEHAAAQSFFKSLASLPACWYLGTEVWVGWVNPKTLALDARTGRSPDTVFTEKGGPSHAKNTGILRATERCVVGKTPSITTLRCPQCHDHGSGRRSNWEMTWPHMPRASRGHSYTEHATTCTHSHQGESAFAH